MSYLLIFFELLHFNIQFLYFVILFFDISKSQSLSFFLLFFGKQKAIQVNESVLSVPGVIFSGLLNQVYLA